MPQPNRDHRKILLIDANTRKQNLRATVLRNHEIEVHAAGSLAEVTPLWRTIAYDLVLLAASEDHEQAALVAAKIRESKPRQRIGLLVGPPIYLQELGCPRKPSKPVDPERPGHVAFLRDVSPPQWAEIIQKVMTVGHSEQATLLGLE